MRTAPGQPCCLSKEGKYDGPPRCRLWQDGKHSNRPLLQLICGWQLNQFLLCCCPESIAPRVNPHGQESRVTQGQCHSQIRNRQRLQLAFAVS